MYRLAHEILDSTKCIERNQTSRKAHASEIGLCLRRTHIAPHPTAVDAEHADTFAFRLLHVVGQRQTLIDHIDELLVTDGFMPFLPTEKQQVRNESFLNGRRRTSSRSFHWQHCCTNLLCEIVRIRMLQKVTGELFDAHGLRQSRRCSFDRAYQRSRSLLQGFRRHHAHDRLQRIILDRCRRRCARQAGDPVAHCGQRAPTDAESVSSDVRSRAHDRLRLLLRSRLRRRWRCFGFLHRLRLGVEYRGERSIRALVSGD